MWAGWARAPAAWRRGAVARGRPRGVYFKLSDVECAYSIQRGYDPPARHRTRPDEAVMKPSAEIVGVAVASTVARPGARAPGGSSHVHAPGRARTAGSGYTRRSDRAGPREAGVRGIGGGIVDPTIVHAIVRIS